MIDHGRSATLLIATNKVAIINQWLVSRLPNPEAAIKLEGSGASVLPPLEASRVAPAPDIELKNTAGETVRLKDLRGRVVFLNFWATWCVPCRTEIPEINAMHRDLQAQGLAVVGASWNDTTSDIEAFRKEIPVDYPILLDAETVGDEFGGVQSFPTTFIIDREGRIRYKVSGQRNRATFEAAVNLLLNEAPPAAAAK